MIMSGDFWPSVEQKHDKIFVHGYNIVMGGVVIL